MLIYRHKQSPLYSRIVYSFQDIRKCNQGNRQNLCTEKDHYTLHTMVSLGVAFAGLTCGSLMLALQAYKKI